MNHRQHLLIAALAAAAMACGDNSQPDPVSLTVYDQDQEAPLSGATVVAHDADGAVVQTARTGADGAAKLDVPSGGMVTAIVEQWPGYMGAFTIMDVEPGDELMIKQPREDGFGLVATAQVSLPGPVPDAFTYQVYSGCEPVIGTLSPEQPLPVELYGACITANNRFHAVAMAFSMDEPYTPLAHSFATHIPIMASGDTEVALPAWRTDWDDHDLTLSGVPAAATELSIQLAAMVDSVPIELWTRTIDVDEPGMAGMDLSARMPAGLSQKLELQLDVMYNGLADGGAGLIQVLGDAPATIAADLEPLLPRIRDVGVTPATRDRTALQWSSDGPLAGDGLLARLVWIADTPMRWELLMPPGAGTRVILPELPEELFAAPPSDTADYVRIRMWAVDSTLVDGYEELRSEHGLAVTPDDLRRQLRTANGDAAVRYSTAGVERDE